MLINSPLTRVWLAYWSSLPTSLPLQKIVLHSYLSVTSSTSDANRLWFLCPWTVKVVGAHHSFQSCKHDANVFCFCDLLLPCRLKKKSQSVDIASQGFSPTLVPASPLNKAAPPVAKTTAVLAVQENNTTNSQRRSPRCGELKRGYTIGNWRTGRGFALGFVCVAEKSLFVHTFTQFPSQSRDSNQQPQCFYYQFLCKSKLEFNYQLWPAASLAHTVWHSCSFVTVGGAGSGMCKLTSRRRLGIQHWGLKETGAKNISDKRRNTLLQHWTVWVDGCAFGALNHEHLF